MVRGVLLLFVSALVLGALFFALRPDAPASAPGEREFEVRVREEGMDPAEIRVAEGDRVRLEVSSERPTELHIHGYDIEEDVAPDKAATLSFDADATGRFEIEDHTLASQDHEGSDGHSHDAVVGTLIVEPR